MAHLPTVTALEVDFATVVIVVLPPTVTVRLVGVAPPAREAITIVEPDTDVTDPLATAAPTPPPGAPEGRSPPPGNPDRGAPVPCPPPPRPAAPHAPFTGGVTLSVAAVNVVAAAELPLGPVANTQSPALIALTVVDTVSVNDVAVLHDTATWPLCWLWTCIVEPETAAIRPEAAGALAPTPGRAPLPGAVEVVA